MKHFVSYRHILAELLQNILQAPLTHARWLNTLSYLENCGAKAIAAFEHRTRVSTIVLKHAAEEFRHAYYLKSQIPKVLRSGLKDYRLEYLMGGVSSKYYIQRLNAAVCRRLHTKLSQEEIKEYAYVLVTYAIERRAQELYREYQHWLREGHSPVSMIGILRDEEGHLQEMEKQLDLMENGRLWSQEALEEESALCSQWLVAIGMPEESVPRA